MKSQRANLFITGLEEDEDESPENCKEIVTNFFSQTMKVSKSIELQSAKRVGTGDPRSMLVTLANANDKSSIYKCGKNLKDVKNSQDKSYFVSDQLTAEKQEEQRRYRDIIKKNNKLSVSETINMSMKKGKLLINEQPYTPKIKTPTIQETLTPDNEATIDKIKLVEGNRIRNGGCRFVGMSHEVRSIQDVRNGYIKARREHPRALHLVCCYRIPGGEFYSLQSYEDNMEWGAGRRLLYMLEDSQIQNRAIYVARYYGGKKLGPSRFNSYIEAMKSAIERSPLNSIINCNQFITSTTPDYAKVLTKKKPRLEDKRRGSGGRGSSIRGFGARGNRPYQYRNQTQGQEVFNHEGDSGEWDQENDQRYNFRARGSVTSSSSAPTTTVT